MSNESGASFQLCSLGWRAMEEENGVAWYGERWRRRMKERGTSEREKEVSGMTWGFFGIFQNF